MLPSPTSAASQIGVLFDAQEHELSRATRAAFDLD
jgi:hypothetical protein